MKRKLRASLRLCSWALLLIACASSCGVDGRALSYEVRALDAAGAGSNGGNTSGNPGASEGGSAADSTDDAGAPSDAGSPSEPGGGQAAAGSDAAGGGSSNGGTTNGGTTNGGTSGAPATSAGSAGQGGSVFNGPCGDLNHDLVDDCSQTLVQNSRFDTSASNWDAEPGLTVTWNAGDASGKPTSGSLLLSHTGDPGTMIGARQCIPATPDTTYDVAARIMLTAGQGQGGVNVYLFDDDACQGNFVAGNTPIAGGETGKWTELLGTLWVRGGVHSMYVRLVAAKPMSQQSLSVLIDDVLITKRLNQ